MDHRFHAFLGLTGLSYFWKMYLLSRNLINVSFMGQPCGDMFNLKKPATYSNLKIQDPFPSKGMDDSLAARMCETGSCETEGSVFVALRTATLQRDLTEMYIVVYNFGMSMIKLSSGYYPALWERTKWFSEDIKIRTICFFLIDNFITSSWLGPLTLTKSGIANELLAMLHMGYLKERLKAFVIMQLVYSISFLPENMRNFGWIMVAFAVFGTVLAIPFAINLTLKQTFPRVRDDPIGGHLKKLALIVGFPPSEIFVGPRVDYPEARYANVLSNQMLFYNHLLTALCTTPEQVVAVVCHEFGRRRVCYWSLRYSSYFVELVVLSYLCMRTIGAPMLHNLFGFETDDDLHPYIVLYLTCIHIWPMVTQAVSCCRSSLMHYLELLADDFACSMGYPLSLMMALLTLAGTSFQYPILDDHWYASFCLGVPTVQTRLARIGEMLGFTEDDY